MEDLTRKEELDIKAETSDDIAQLPRDPDGRVQKPSSHLDATIKRSEDALVLPVDSIPWKYRIPAFCLIVLFGTGASFADVTIGPLKSTLIRELKINSQ